MAGQLLVRREIGRGSLVARLAYEHGGREVKPRPCSDWHEKLEGLPDLENLDENRQRKRLVKSSTLSLRQYDGNLVIVAF